MSMGSSAAVSPPPKRWKTIVQASIVSLVLFILWWGGIIFLDGVFAATFPYQQYETIALLYPDVFYPGLPGWYLTQIPPFPFSLYIVAIGWMIVLSVVIGTIAAWYSDRSGHSSLVTAAAIVILMFIMMTGIEAAVLLLG